MFELISESGENRSQSAGETLQPLPNTRAATQESATGSDPQTQRIGSDGWLPSSRSRPCPVCSRTKDGDCRISADGEQVICHHPKDLAPGTVTNGWAFTKNTSDGRAGHFTIDKPRSRTTTLRSKVVPLRTPAPAAEPAPDPAAITLARLPQAHKQPPAHWPHGQILPYGSDGQQWAKVVVDAKGKRHLPHHIDANGKTISKAGPTPWPLWCEAMALEHGPGKWIVETEGEKCAAWFHAAALVAISQPGHDHKQDKIQARYARIVAAGVAGVVYLADHDKTGSEKAHKCAAAAAAVNLPFITVPAAEVWPGLPAGGSIDDAPGTAADRAAAFNAQLQQRKPKQQAQQAATCSNGQVAELPASFQHLINSLPDGWQPTDNGLVKTPASVGRIAELIEENAGQLLRYNEMTLYVEAHTAHGWEVVTDHSMDSAYVNIDQKGWKITLESVIKAICHVARQRSIHPVRQYLLRIEQDSSITPYDLDRVGPDMFRALLPLHAAMVRKWLVGAVARALNPGCQMDYCLVLQSPEQGIYKSTSFSALASQDWHTSTVPKDDKDFLLNIHSTWIYELAELESVTTKRAAGHMKNLITTRADNFRIPYGRTTETRKRTSVFCGTANTDTFLRDETGNRRYWVVPISGNDKLNIQAIKKYRDSIWKAAVLAYKSGEIPMLSTEQEISSEQQNEGFKEQHAWLEMLHAWMNGTPLARFKPEDPTPQPYFPGIEYAPQDILYSAGLKRPDQINNRDATTLGPLLRSLGFETRRVLVGKSKVRRWIKDHPETTWTTPDHPETAAGGPANPPAAQSISEDGPPGPPEKQNIGKKQAENRDVTVARQAHENHAGKLLKHSGGPSHPTAETTSVCNGSDRTTCPPVAGGLSGGPEPISHAWLPQLLAIRAAHPTAHGQLVDEPALMGEHGIASPCPANKAALQHLAESD
jgi:hypothetical protein